MVTTTRKFDTCAACRQRFTTAPVFRADTIYCCEACASGRLCACRVEEELAADGVDRIGLPFAVEAVPEQAEEVATATGR